MPDRLGYGVSEGRLSVMGQFKLKGIVEPLHDHVFEDTACLRQVVEISADIELQRR
jgi:hypothetical protein